MTKQFMADILTLVAPARLPPTSSGARPKLVILQHMVTLDHDWVRLKHVNPWFVRT